MYQIIFYRDKQGKEPVKEYILSLSKRETKENRVLLNKIRDYIKILERFGTRAGEPYIKHLQGGIWELRPIRERILFAALVNGRFVLLHHFMKKTQKTPQREIAIAQKRFDDLLERVKDE